MDLDIIREFILLAESCNFQVAADRLSLSQSALSKHIHKLEEELETDLFDRSKRRVTLNEDGRVFLGYAREIYKLYDACTFEMKHLKQRSSNTLRVGMVGTQDRFDIIEKMTDYCVSNPDIQLEMLDQERIIGKADLTNGKCDFFFTTDIDEYEEDEFMKIPVSEDRLVALIPADHHLASRDRIELKDLVSERIIEHSSHYEQQLIEKMANAYGIRLNIVASVSYSQAVLRMVDQGMGIALICEGCLRDMDDQNKKIIDLEYEGDFTVYLVYKKRKLSKEASKFVSIFADESR